MDARERVCDKPRSTFQQLFVRDNFAHGKKVSEYLHHFVPSVVTGLVFCSS